MRKYLILIIAMLLATPALAQDNKPDNKSSAPPPDPRVQAAMIDALQSMLRLRETQMMASTRDSQERINALLEKCGEACKDKPSDKPAEQQKQ